MSTNTIIQQQHSIIQRSYSTMDDYERSKADAEAQYEREKETLEGTWKHDRDEADALINAIRQVMKTTQDAISGTGWQDKVGGGIPRSSPITLEAFDLFQQMTQCRSTAELISNKIIDFLKKHSTRSEDVAFRRTIVGAVGVSLGFLALIFAAALLPGVFNPVIGILILIAPIILAFVLFGRQAVPVSDIKNDYITITHITSNAEDLYKQQLAILQQTYQRQLNECQARHMETMRQLDQRLVSDLAALQHASTEVMRDVGIQGLGWDDPTWRQ
ncbi:MAG TPA: hypothetical protein VFA10_16960 [Ktedonobacteraceae bacterium]|nr:hypothetical protein [Ktedonobacteraceae bacterium]